MIESKQLIKTDKSVRKARAKKSHDQLLPSTLRPLPLPGKSPAASSSEDIRAHVPVLFLFAFPVASPVYMGHLLGVRIFLPLKPQCLVGIVGGSCAREAAEEKGENFQTDEKRC